MSTKLSMRQFRIEVFRGLFLYEFYDEDYDEQLFLMYDQDTHFDEIKISEEDGEKIIQKCRDVISRVESIDESIDNNLDKWTINRIGKVELTILRLAVYEYRYDKLDAAIVINEAIEIAKIYGGDKSGAFINGVMAKIVKSDDKQE